MSSLNSIAAWCELTKEATSRSNDRQLAVEYHINLWHFSDAKRQNFLEIGIKSTDPGGLAQVRLFLPFKIARNEIKDLGPKFRDVGTAQGIFNEPLSSKLSEDSRCVELSDGNRVNCAVHQFGEAEVNIIDEDELVLDEVHSGTMVTITQQALMSLAKQAPDGAHGYFRLRFTPSETKFKPFITVIKPPDRVWNSGFELIEYIDCRINEPRALPQKVETAFRDARGRVAKIDEIVFLVVAPVDSTITSSHSQWHKCRLLENEIWKKYTSFDLKGGLLVYHWKKVFENHQSERFPSFSVFVKIQSRKSNFLTILLYLSLAFILGVIGSLTASVFLHFISYLQIY